MIAEFIGEERGFYSINARLREQDGGIYGVVSCVPLFYGASTQTVLRTSGMLTEEDMAVLSRLFGEDKFFIPPAPGCYVGIPKLPITRVIMLSMGNREAALHIRCTPLTTMLEEMMGGKRALLVRDIIAGAVAAGQSIIICGRSGIGKTRLLVTEVFPHLPSGSVYVETLPELVGFLCQAYPPPDYQYYTILQPGLTRKGALNLGDVIQFLRSSSPHHVVLQEAHTQATGYATPEELKGLVSSGVPFTITAHPSFESAIETARYYTETYGIKGAATVVIQLSDRGITFSHATSQRTMIFAIVPFSSREQVFVDTSNDLPAAINRVISLASSEPNQR